MNLPKYFLSEFSLMLNSKFANSSGLSIFAKFISHYAQWFVRIHQFVLLLCPCNLAIIRNIPVIAELDFKCRYTVTTVPL